MKSPFLTFFFALLSIIGFSQTKTPNPRPLTLDEYKKALTYQIANLDQDTYVKFDNAYVLDRYEGRKPYFITGTDKLKKRIDLYKLIAKEGLQELGTMVFYTSETGKKFQVLVPNFTAEFKVWDQYFRDVDQINLEEKNFSLKLSYVLSKELSFQQYKIINGGKDLKEESATYGSDICFPGEEWVDLRNGSKKFIKNLIPGDEIKSLDPSSHQAFFIKVKSLTVHPAKNYALTRLVLVHAEEIQHPLYTSVNLKSLIIEGTPNHPMPTQTGSKKLGDLDLGESILGIDEASRETLSYQILQKNTITQGAQKVYNIVADQGSNMVLNGVVVLQK